MRIKDSYSIYRDVQVPIDIERTLYQKGQIKYGFFDIYGSNGYIQRSDNESAAKPCNWKDFH